MEIPEALQHLPVYHGLPVPWLVHVGKDGVPQFRVRDVQRNREAVRYQLCDICGRWVKGPYTFPVGPLTLEQRCVFGGPMHDACARAALQLCPFLVQERWQRSEPRPGERLAVEPDEVPPKPSKLALATVAKYRGEQGPNGMWYSSFADDELLSVEWWTYVDGKLTAPGRAPP